MANEILKGSLDPACIRLELNSSGRDEAVRELVGLIHAKYRLRNVEDIVQVVLERERKMSTSLENGIAVPHGKSASSSKMPAPAPSSAPCRSMMGNDTGF